MVSLTSSVAIVMIKSSASSFPESSTNFFRISHSFSRSSAPPIASSLFADTQFNPPVFTPAFLYRPAYRLSTTAARAQSLLSTRACHARASIKPRHDETVRRFNKLRFELELQQSVAIDGAHLLNVITDDE